MYPLLLLTFHVFIFQLCSHHTSFHFHYDKKGDENEEVDKKEVDDENENVLLVLCDVD